jgi:hypothetical protein
VSAVVMIRGVGCDCDLPMHLLQPAQGVAEGGTQREPVLVHPGGPVTGPCAGLGPALQFEMMLSVLSVNYR